MKLQEFSDELRKDQNFVIAELRLKLEEANAQLAALTEQTRWIPVEERLPEDNQVVIGFIWISASVVVARYCKRELAFYEYWRGGQITVTNWMPLPNPPEAQND